MHFQIRFRTEYVYDAPVTDNLNALRVRPATTSTQRCDDFIVRIDPEARVQRHVDYFGTEAPEAPWEALESASYGEAAGEYVLPWPEDEKDPRIDELTDLVRASNPAS